ncbi:glycosyltransferase [Endozoicomonadaceae bacterium StTr2]
MSDLVVFGEDWGGHPSSTQHLIRCMMNQRQVVWVNSIGLRSPRLSLHDLNRVLNKGMEMLKPQGDESREIITDRHAEPIIINPRVIPFYQSTLIREINSSLLNRTITPVLEARNIVRPMLWTSLPSAVDVVGTLNECGSVYYCGDDFSALAGVDHKTIAGMEAELAEKVDLIVVASEQLAGKFPAHKTQVLPHGVDFELFSTPHERPHDLPEAEHIAGFYGSISEWLDQELLAQAATALPSWQFVLIGDISTDISTLQSIPNITLLGAKHHHELAAYVQHWDVAMLPFILNEQIKACNPLKLREYMASGTPIATTRFPAVEAYEEHLTLRNPREPFAHTLRRALETADKYQDRQQQVIHESWQARAAQLNGWLSAIEHPQT